MRKIRMMEHISLDGVIAPSGEDDYANGGWTAAYRSPEGELVLCKSTRIGMLGRCEEHHRNLAFP